MNDLIIAWQDSLTRNWYPVGRLGYEQGQYFFSYTKGATVSPHFTPFGWMRDLNAFYVSEKLFPLFENRLLSKSRPEYADFIRWTGFEDSVDVNELELLGRTGGIRATDTLEIFPIPAPNFDGKYVGYFFAHGLRYILPENVNRVVRLTPGERLLLVLDIQNPHDKSAILLRTVDPACTVGYCPRYLASEFCDLIEHVGQENVTVTVAQVNSDAPTDLKLLCKIVSDWPKNFNPCSKDLYEPLVEFDALRKMSILKKASESKSLTSNSVGTNEGMEKHRQ
jgi:hypothetical protein